MYKENKLKGSFGRSQLLCGACTNYMYDLLNAPEGGCPHVLEKIRKFLGKRARHVKVKVVQRNSQDLEKPQEARNFENPARI